MGVAEARPEIGREAEVGGDVSELGKEKAMVGASEVEEAVELGGEGVIEGFAESGVAGGEGGSGRGE